uniref:Uncharacterized protein n=1 Tax=Manihot esculenta TaxID=3983 RepID=A0A199UAC9_MANES
MYVLSSLPLPQFWTWGNSQAKFISYYKSTSLPPISITIFRAKSRILPLSSPHYCIRFLLKPSIINQNSLALQLSQQMTLACKSTFSLFGKRNKGS